MSDRRVLALLNSAIQGEALDIEVALLQVRERFRELLEADLEFDIANASLKKAGRCKAPERVRRFHCVVAATSRRQAAIARCVVGA